MTNTNQPFKSECPAATGHHAQINQKRRADSIHNSIAVEPVPLMPIHKVSGAEIAGAVSACISRDTRKNGFRINGCPQITVNPADIRKVIYTTNAIESVNMSLRKLTKNRGSFPSDEALTKLFYLALRNISQKWTMPIRDWKAALTRFTIQFGDRISAN